MNPNQTPTQTHLTALIADDEEAPRAQLRAALAAVWPELQIVAEAVNGVDAWDAYLEHEPDVCFLDIRMPGASGIEVAQRIQGRTPVVFVTAFGDHALAAFEAGAVDYLLKPVERERVAQTAARLRQRLSEPALAGAQVQHNLAALMDQLMRQQRRTPRLATLQAAVGREVRLIRIDDVLYFESDSRYTRVVYRSEGVDAEALLRLPLKELLPQLDDEAFWQVHRSVIVRRDLVAAAVRTGDNQMHLTLRGRPETLPVSRHFQPLFKGQ
ncbi:MAG: response regulator transcription factor [Burkholderiaceae bacterium]|nr:response regulator transcription factor [Burkholderiaceae bacterium]